MRHQRSTETATVVMESLTIRILADGQEFEATSASEFELEAAFTYLPAIPPVLTGPWEDADPGAAPEIEITALRVVKDTRFDCDVGMDQPPLALIAGAGRDLLKNFSPAELEAIEDDLLGRAITGVRNAFND